MNILFVSAVLPYPLHSGGQIRIYNLIKRLSRRHRITLVSFIRSEEERAFQKNLSFCERVYLGLRGRAWQPKYMGNALFGKYPFLLATYDNAVMRKTLANLLSEKQFDIIHAEPFYVWPSIPENTLPMVVSEHNIEYDVYKRFTPWFARLDTAKLAFWEHYVWNKAKMLTAVSEEDAVAIRKDVSVRVTVVPNGVDLKIFRYRKPNNLNRPTILFVGNFRWRPNREAARTLLVGIWPKITRALPGAALRIVGKDMPKEFQKFGVSADDISKVYHDADILVAPHEIAGGTKFKMLEAMATGLPIVTTREGAAGLSMKAGVHYLEADDTQGFVDQIKRLCDNTALTRTITKNARRLVETTYNWDDIAQKLEYVWKNA